MSSVLNAIASYQGINSFYNISRAEITGIPQESGNAPAESNNLQTDDEAAFASISPEAMSLFNAEQQSGSDTNSQNDELTQQEQQEVSELKTTDAQVRAHEHAHLAAAAGLKTSGPNYEL